MPREVVAVRTSHTTGRVVLAVTGFVVSGLTFPCLLFAAPGDTTATGPLPARTLHFPADKSMGTLYIRDWGSTDTTAWRSLASKPKGKVSVPAAKELKLVVTKGEPTIWHEILSKAGINVDTSSLPPDLPSLPALGSADLQVLDLLIHNQDILVVFSSVLKSIHELS